MIMQDLCWMSCWWSWGQGLENLAKMNDNILLDEKLARVLDILEQVKELNKMIDLHRNQSGDDFMVNQYSDMKNRFLYELKEILSDYEIEVLIDIFTI